MPTKMDDPRELFPTRARRSSLTENALVKALPTHEAALAKLEKAATRLSREHVPA
jgi:hypothetical protein